MRISLVTDTFLPEVNGVTTVLAVMRAGLRERGHRVQVIAPRYPGMEPDTDLDVTRRPSVPCPGYPQVRLSWPWSRVVRSALHRFAPDLVHVITEGPLGGIGRRYAIAHDLPLVTSFHTDFPRYARRYLGAWATRPAQRYLVRFHSAAALTQTPSETTCAELRGLGLPRAVVWGRGVDTTLFSPGRRSEARRAELGAAGKVLVLHVGRLAVEKDIDTLLAAFAQAQARLRSRAVFCIAGDGPKGADARRALPEARHFGFLRRDVLADLYADADLFVFPSPTETCGLVALEAMASGLPVLTADQGGVLENLRDGLNGLLVPAGDADRFAAAIVELADNADQRSAMAQAARAFAVGREWARELDALTPMYEQAIARATRTEARVSARPELADGAAAGRP